MTKLIPALILALIAIVGCNNEDGDSTPDPENGTATAPPSED